MKRIMVVGVMSFFMLLVSGSEVKAQIPVLDIIKEGIKKVIVAVDLQIQRLQNRTIWLQNAQKTLENEMSKLKLGEITGWVEKQKKLYQDYFDELWRVKAAIAYYHKVKDIINRQGQLVREYKASWALFKQDKNFTAQELDYMVHIYSGLLGESVKSVDQLALVVSAFVTQMSDGKRMEIIDGVAEQVETQLSDLRQFNNQNKVLSLQRGVERGEIESVRILYGL